MASSKLSYTQGTPTDNNTWTFSAWIKKSHFGSSEGIIFSAYDSASSMTNLRMNGSGDSCTLAYWDYQGSYTGRLVTSRSLRDANGWYHVVVVWDSDNATPGDRMKMYINGVEETAFGTDTNPSSGQSTVMNTASQVLEIGAANSADYFDGLMSNIVFVDGTALAATEFGEVDSTSGIWKFKAPAGITYGNNGFWLKGENSGALGTDSSGEGNTLTVSGSPTQSIDTPSNVYAVMNSIATTNSIGNTLTFSNANLTATNTVGGAWQPMMSSLAANTGKWYAEFKVATIGGASKYGIIDVIQYNNQVNWASASRAYGYEYYQGDATNNSTTASYGAAFTTGAIIGVAMDLDNMKLYMSKDGVWQDSGDPTSGSTGTGTLPFFGGASNTARAAGVDTYAFAMNIHNSSVTNANFGSGYFGSTAVSSAGTSSTGDDSIWEHDCPTGYYGLNTKNLNTYG